MDRQTLRSLAGVFGRCFLLFAGVQAVLFGLSIGLHDFAYTTHTRFFDVTPQAFDLALYAFFGAMKVLGIALFLTPWAALRLMAARAPQPA